MATKYMGEHHPSDPSDASDGSYWYNIATGKMRTKQNGVISDMVGGGGGGGYTPPTGTGFVHITGGSQDAAAKLVANADVDAAAGIAESKLSLNFATHSNANDPTADEKAALAGVGGAPSGTNKYVTNSDSRMTDARTPTAHTHDDRYYTETEVDTALTAKQATSEKGAASGYAGLDAGTKVPTAQLGGAGADNTKFLRGDQTWAAPPGGGQAFPVGSVFIAVVSTDPATLLGYGTWVSIAAGRVLVGLDSGDVDFDTVEETGGAKTVTLTAAQSGLPQHTHLQNSHSHVQKVNSATTGGLSGYTPDTSTNTPVNSGYSTDVATAVNQDAGPTNASQAHSNVQPYFVVYMWKRTA